jgi:hypothetical protein
MSCCGLDGCGLIPDKGKFFHFTTISRPVWGLPSLSSAYFKLFPKGLSGWSVKVTHHLHQMLKSRICGGLFSCLCYVV